MATNVSTATASITDNLKEFVVVWAPSMNEFLLFAVFMGSLYVLSVLIFYNQVQIDFKNTSRCYRDARSSTVSGQYTGTATNQKGDPLYKVGYNIAAKSFDVSCACPTGTVTNTYPNIDVYNLNTRQAQRINSKVCSCDQQYYSPTTDSIYYAGYPGVTRFMRSASGLSTEADVNNKADTSFFEDAINNGGISAALKS